MVPLGVDARDRGREELPPFQGLGRRPRARDRPGCFRIAMEQTPFLKTRGPGPGPDRSALGGHPGPGPSLGHRGPDRSPANPMIRPTLDRQGDP